MQPIAATPPPPNNTREVETEESLASRPHPKLQYLQPDQNWVRPERRDDSEIQEVQKPESTEFDRAQQVRSCQARSAAELSFAVQNDARPANRRPADKPADLFGVRHAPAPADVNKSITRTAPTQGTEEGLTAKHRPATELFKLLPSTKVEVDVKATRIPFLGAGLANFARHQGSERPQPMASFGAEDGMLRHVAPPDINLPVTSDTVLRRSTASEHVISASDRTTMNRAPVGETTEAAGAQRAMPQNTFNRSAVKGTYRLPNVPQMTSFSRRKKSVRWSDREKVNLVQQATVAPAVGATTVLPKSTGEGAGGIRPIQANFTQAANGTAQSSTGLVNASKHENAIVRVDAQAKVPAVADGTSASSVRSNAVLSSGHQDSSHRTATTRPLQDFVSVTKRANFTIVGARDAGAGAATSADASDAPVATSNIHSSVQATDKRDTSSNNVNPATMDVVGAVGAADAGARRQTLVVKHSAGGGVRRMFTPLVAQGTSLSTNNRDSAADVADSARAGIVSMPQVQPQHQDTREAIREFHNTDRIGGGVEVRVGVPGTAGMAQQERPNVLASTRKANGTVQPVVPLGVLEQREGAERGKHENPSGWTPTDGTNDREVFQADRSLTADEIASSRPNQVSEKIRTAPLPQEAGIRMFTPLH